MSRDSNRIVYGMNSGEARTFASEHKCVRPDQQWKVLTDIRWLCDILDGIGCNAYLVARRGHFIARVHGKDAKTL